MELMKDVVHKVRSARASLGLQKRRCNIFAVCAPAKMPLMEQLATDISTLTYADKVECLALGCTLPSGSVACPINANIMAYLPVANLVDLVKESLKIHKNMAKLLMV